MKMSRRLPLQLLSLWRARPRAIGTGLIVAGLLVIAGAAGLDTLDRAFPPRLLPPEGPSPVVLDRHDRLLATFTAPDGRYRLASPSATVDPVFLKLLIAYEDRRFADHAGVDPRSVARAGVDLVRRGHIVSGASTLTMQVARLIDGARERAFARKLREAARAVQIERRLTKAEILDLYLALAPYGGNLEGIRAASLAWFGREPDRLTLAQSALLVALPQSPETRRPDRFPEAARRARDRVLERAVRLGVIPAADAALARREPVPRERRPFPRLAPHLSERLVRAEPGRSVYRLTLDRPLQAELEALVADRVRAFGPAASGAIVVLDHREHEVRALVGSPGLAEDRRLGHVDMTEAVRSPGSSLKPFIYGLAFEAGIAHPETLVEDRPTPFGTYRPGNFDATFQGTVTARVALQQSLNVPAVALLEAVGPVRLAVRLEEAGVKVALPRDAAPGLAIGLGGIGMRLTDLALLHAGLAEGGLVTPPVLERDRIGPPAPPVRLLDPVAAWQVGDVLAGTPPPENGLLNRIAFKTGTSYGYRDAWAAGFDGRHAVAVWVGRADGQPMPGMTGRLAAAPVLFETFARIAPHPAPLPGPPPGTLIAATSGLPAPLRAFGAATAGADARAARPVGLRFIYPPDGARVSLGGDGAGQPLAWALEGTRDPVMLLVNGRPARGLGRDRQGFLLPPGPGLMTLTALDATGASARVRIFIDP